MATPNRSTSKRQGENTSKLQESLDFAQSILDTVQEPMLVLDGDLRVQMASRAFCRRFEVTAAETEGRLVYELGNGQWNIPRLRLLLEEIIPQDSVFDDFEVVHDFPHIGCRVMLLNARRVWREGDHSDFILLAVEDITERQLAEEERRRLAKVNQELMLTTADLTRSNEDLERFAHVAAHDLKSPVNTIVMFTQRLARLTADVRSEEAQQHLAFIENAAQRLVALIQDLLSYSVIPQVPFPPESALAQAACAAALASLDSAIRESAADVRCDVKPEVSVAVPMSLLVQLLQNLIGNAIQYRRKNMPPRVSVSAADQGQQWLFSVEDNGTGIEDQYLEAVFEPFRRLHGHETPGSGIGLATCKRIVERAGGRIWANSQLGEGSTFCFLLPKS
jgi:two-component system CheB/CheR fusion protein